ncbi:unnamed protein product [Phaedon cochleariae]|uniref:Uncharacterized protein n=1 Tax=Phaedon cochleariae TaxID=80249 RepID=A0A9N9X2C1_PHACE|nr:unnamed protein product [Phaedon cochleariae]
MGTLMSWVIIGSGDDVHSSDLSCLTSSTDSEANPGYKEVSAERLRNVSDNESDSMNNEASSEESMFSASDQSRAETDMLSNLEKNLSYADSKQITMSPEIPLIKIQYPDDISDTVSRMTDDDNDTHIHVSTNENIFGNLMETTSSSSKEDNTILQNLNCIGVPDDTYYSYSPLEEGSLSDSKKINIVSVHNLEAIEWSVIKETDTMGFNALKVNDNNMLTEIEIPLFSDTLMIPAQNKNRHPNSTNNNAGVAEEDIQTSSKRIDRVIANFGLITRDHNTSKLDCIENSRPWTKKNTCPYCFVDITHFSRHLQRNHAEEGAVQELLSLQTRDPKRKKLLNAIRRQGNFVNNEKGSVLRPVRRPRKKSEDKNEDEDSVYLACDNCLGYFKKPFMRRHRRKCTLRVDIPSNRENHLSLAQAFSICSNSGFYDNLRLKKEVIDNMRSDDISKAAIRDVLICSYAESQLKKHKRIQAKITVSNRMRELGRLLLVVRQINGTQRFIDLLKPECFDNIVTGTKIISGYDKETRTFTASSLALHMGTRLKQVCDIATKLIIQKYRFLPCNQPELYLKNIKRFRNLVEHHWSNELSSLALKDLNEKNWEKPKLLPLTSEVMQFQKFVMAEAITANDNIKENKNLQSAFRRLTECVLALTLLLNRKRIGEVQYLKLKTYNTDVQPNEQDEILKAISESEKILCKNFKRVITGGKGSKPVAILFPTKIQSFIKTLLSYRTKCVADTNQYLFANPRTENRWLSGYHILKKLAEQSGVNNRELFTSTRLRKQIATVLQIMNITETEMEQFANFMGHTMKTHEQYYRLPQDVYQTAKVSKLLLAINSGKGALYKGKTLDEIDFSDDVESDDSDSEETKEIFTRKNSISKSEITNSSKLMKIAVPGTSESDFNNDYEDNPSSDEDEVENPKKKKKAGKTQRIRWTEEQKRIISTFFRDHIRNKIAPKKLEVEKLMQQNKKLFKSKNWVKIKAYVYNCYRDK